VRLAISGSSRCGGSRRLHIVPVNALALSGSARFLRVALGGCLEQLELLVGRHGAPMLGEGATEGDRFVRHSADGLGAACHQTTMSEIDRDAALLAHAPWKKRLVWHDS